MRTSRVASFKACIKRLLDSRTPEQIHWDTMKVRTEARRQARNQRRAKVVGQPPHPPEHYIESRTMFIEESRRHLVMFQNHEFLPEAIQADIRLAESEISYAQHRIRLGLTDPY